MFSEIRILWCQTPAPVPGLRLLSFTGEEQLSGLFRFELSFLLGETVPFVEEMADNWIGRDVGFGLEDVAGGDFHGVVLALGFDEDERCLRAEVGPRLALLKQSKHYRTFAGKTVKQITEEVFQEGGLRHFDFRLGQRRYTPREVCLQCGESDADFLMRLWEEEGIFFYFEVTRSQHLLVLADHSPALARGPIPVVPRLRHDSVVETRGSGLETWQWQRRFTPGGAQVTGHFPPTPRANLTGAATAATTTPAETACQVEEGLFRCATRNEAEEMANLRHQARQAGRSLIRASGNHCLRPGQVFSRTGAAERYLALVVRHAAQEGDNGRMGGYSNALECQPLSVPFRPPCQVAKPRLAGYHPAIVVGKTGTTGDREGIFLDKLGRVRVRFRWEAKEDLQHTVPVRVAHGWPGSLGPPLPGQEVAIVFEDGDPDRPVLLGLLPTAADRLPHDPEKHTSGYTLRLPSNPPGDREGETVFQAEIAQGKQKAWLQLPGDFYQKIAKELRTLIAKDFSLEVRGNLWQKVGEVLNILVGKEIVLQADQKITFKVGGNVIVLAASGITINGTMVYINSPGGPSAGDAGSPRPPEQLF